MGTDPEDLEETELPDRGQAGYGCYLEQLGRGGADSSDGFSRTQTSLGVDSMPCL